MRLNPLLVLGLLGAAAGLAAGAAHANFAASDGFTGRNGFTCTSCHAVPPPLGETATAVLEGLPAAWTPGASYLLTIRVEGGPPALPAPAPQGGFEVESDLGTFDEAPGFEELLRQPHPWSVAYEPAGSRMREWQVAWTAPRLVEAPREANFWLAVVAASGNHVVLTNTSDSGEKHDAVASLHATVPPADGLLEAWRALPLAAPEVASSSRDGATWTLAGRHTDGNATHLSWRLDGARWEARPTATAWRLVLEGLGAGDHRLDLRSEGAGRASPIQPFVLQGDAAVPADEARDSPAPFLAPALLPALLLRRRRP